MPTVAPPTTELGYVASWASFATGIGLSGMALDDLEETPELVWPSSTGVYSRMRRTDAQVQATMWALTLPLRRPNVWALDPGKAREEVVRQIADDLDLPILGMEREPLARSRGRFSWLEHVRLALLDLCYGHMPFEIVLYVDDAGKVRLRKLAPRFPQTLAAINVASDGGLISIDQYAPSSSLKPVRIPVERLVFYCNDREGGNWFGRSVLRSCYKHWLLKDRLLRTQAMSIERTGMGVPVINAPPNANAAQMTELNLMARNYRAGESAGGALPYDAKLTLVGITGTVPDALPVVGYHDTAIARGMLTQFLQYGTDGNSGNRALVGGVLDFFAMAVGGIASRYASTTTLHVVEDLVDLNWGPDEPAPRIVALPIDTDRDIDPAAVLQLVQSGALTPDDSLEDWARQRYNMPKRGGIAHPHGTMTPGVGSADPASQPIAASRSPRRSPVVIAAKTTRKRFLAALSDHYAPLVADALSASINARSVARRFLAGSSAVAAATSTATRARNAVTDEGMDLSDLEAALTDLYGESYVVGGHAALSTLPGDSPLAPAWDALVDWKSWVPGAAMTAVGLALADGSRSLSSLRDGLGSLIDGIAATTIDRLSNALVDGEGESLARLTMRLEDVLGDGSRASMIAGTEANRSMSAASTDSFRDNGIEAREWVALDDPCPECEAMDGMVAALDEPFPDLGDVPGHVACRCSTLPATLPGLVPA